MKSLVDHLGQYAEYHRDRRNIFSHFIGIPLIVVAVAVLLSRPGLPVAGLWLSPALLTALAGLALIGAVVGTFAGLFFGPVGLFVGPFVGALLGELWHGKELGQATKVGLGTWLGIVLGIVLKLGLAFGMLGLFAFAWFV